MMLDSKEFFRPDPLGREKFVGSGADWLEPYKPFIEDGKTVVVSPHKTWGPQTNDLVFQLRKRRPGVPANRQLTFSAASPGDLP